MRNFLSSRQEHGKVNTLVCILFINQEPVNLFHNKPFALELSGNQIG